MGRSDPLFSNARIACVTCGHVFYEHGKWVDTTLVKFPMLIREVDRTSEYVIRQTPECCPKTECITAVLQDASWQRRDVLADALREEYALREKKAQERNLKLQPLLTARMDEQERAYEEELAAEKYLRSHIGDHSVATQAIQRFFAAKENVASCLSPERFERERVEEETYLANLEQKKLS